LTKIAQIRRLASLHKRRRAALAGSPSIVEPWSG
jgi:hypothetical protein